MTYLGDDDNQQDQVPHLPWLWMIHYVPEAEGEAQIERDNIARVGDKVVFESMQYPG